MNSAGHSLSNSATVEVFEMTGAAPKLTAIPAEEVQAAVLSGKFALPANRDIEVFNPEGVLGEIPSGQTLDAFKTGYVFATPEKVRKYNAEKWWSDKTNELFLGRPAQNADTQAIIEANPAVFFVGELLGAILIQVIIFKLLSAEREGRLKDAPKSGVLGQDRVVAGVLTLILFAFYCGLLHSIILTIGSVFFISIWLMGARMIRGGAMTRLPNISISINASVGEQRSTAKSVEAVPDKERPGA